MIELFKKLILALFVCVLLINTQAQCNRIGDWIDKKIGRSNALKICCASALGPIAIDIICKEEKSLKQGLNAIFVCSCLYQLYTWIPYIQTYEQRKAHDKVLSALPKEISFILHKEVLELGAKNCSYRDRLEFMRPMKKERQVYYNKLLAMPWSSISKKYITEFQEQECAIITELLHMFGLTLEQWNTFHTLAQDFINKQKQLAQDEVKTGLHFIPDSHKDAINKLLNYCGVDPKTISIGRTNASSAFMAAKFSEIFLSDNAFLNPIDDDFNHAVLHEAQHLLHNDCLNGIIMTFISCHYPNFNAALYESLSFKWKRLQEKRADVLACLSDMGLAHSYRDNLFLDALTEKVHFFMDYNKDEHDWPSERRKYMDQLCSEQDLGLFC